jgi:hypothetical protein
MRNKKKPVYLGGIFLWTAHVDIYTSYIIFSRKNMKEKR